MRLLIVINIAVGKRLATDDKTHHKMLGSSCFFNAKWL